MDERYSIPGRAEFINVLKSFLVPGEMSIPSFPYDAIVFIFILNEIIHFHPTFCSMKKFDRLFEP